MEFWGGLDLGRGALPGLAMRVSREHIQMAFLGLFRWPSVNATPERVFAVERTHWPRKGIRVRYRTGFTSMVFRTWGDADTDRVAWACRDAGWLVRESYVD